MSCPCFTELPPIHAHALTLMNSVGLTRKDDVEVGDLLRRKKGFVKRTKCDEKVMGMKMTKIHCIDV